MGKSKQTAVRFTPDDFAVLHALQAKLGVLSQTEVVRMALRALAREQNVEVKKKK